MHFSTAISALVIAATAVNAVPAADTGDDIMNSVGADVDVDVDVDDLADDLQTRAPISDIIHLYPQFCFNGNPYRGQADPERCVDLGGPMDFNNRAKGGRARSGFLCFIYRDLGCKGPRVQFSSEGDPKFDRELLGTGSSWKCRKIS